MKLLWLGQNGLLFDFDGLKIMVDPYLTDSLAEQGKEFTRKTKINKKLFGARPDIIILTNGHLDHADDDSIEKLLKHMGKKKRATILSCESVYDYITTVPKMSGANHIMLEKYSEWTVGNINIRAVPARTDDKSAFGVVITDFASGKKYYVAGDTLYNARVIESLPKDVYAAFLPINGEYGSMNVTDAKRFAMAINPRFCVPVHFGMFDKIDPNAFDLPNAIIPKAYKVINFDDYETPKDEESKKDSGTEKNFSCEEMNNSIDDCGDETNAANDDANVIVFDFDCDEIVNESADETVEESIDESADEVVGKIADEAVDEIVDEVVNDTGDEIADNADTSNNEVNKIADEIVSEAIGEVFNEIDEIDKIDGFDSDDNTVIYGTVDEATKNETEPAREKLNDEDKIDAYIREIEKFERGETADFSKIDS